MWPQILVFAAICFRIGVIATRFAAFPEREIWHEAPRYCGALAGYVTLIVLLYWGGFFDCFWR